MPGSGSSTSPAPVPRWRPGRSCAGTSAPSRDATARRSSGDPAREWVASSRRVAAASAEPPPIPPATGMCFSICTRTGGPSQPVRGAERRERRERQVVAVDARTHDLVAAVGTGLERQPVEQVHALEHRHELVHARRRALGPDEQADIDLRRGDLAQRRHDASASCSATKSSGDEPLGARVGRMAERDQRRARAVADPGGRVGRQRQRAGQRLAPVGERRRCTSARSSGDGAGARVRTSTTQHRVDVRHRVEDACAKPAAARARRTASWASTGRRP